MKAAPEATKRDIYTTCHYCGLHHADVEAGGIYYCPNSLCSGPGAAWFRHKLDSFKSVDNDRHTIDEDEWIGAALKRLSEAKDDTVRAKIRATAAQMLAPESAA